MSGENLPADTGALPLLDLQGYELGEDIPLPEVEGASDLSDPEDEPAN
jgi:hypothetical protein